MNQTSQQPKHDAENSPRFQVSIRALLLLTAWGGALFACVSNQWLFGGVSVVALGGVLLIVVDVVRNRNCRGWGLGLLAVWVVYLSINVVGFLVTMSGDPFAIFHGGYFLFVFLPPILLVMGAWFSSMVHCQLAHSLQCSHRLALCGFTLCVGCVVFGQLLVVAMCSAAV